MYSDKHFVSTSPENQHFNWEQKAKSVQNFRAFTVIKNVTECANVIDDNLAENEVRSNDKYTLLAHMDNVFTDAVSLLVLLGSFASYSSLRIFNVI